MGVTLLTGCRRVDLSHNVANEMAPLLRAWQLGPCCKPLALPVGRYTIIQDSSAVIK